MRTNLIKNEKYSHLLIIERRNALKSKAIFKFGVIALSIVLVACSGGSSDEAGCPVIEDRKINVVATTPMIGEFVNQVGGDNINLTVIMPAEADPHTYEPAPQDAGTIADADLVFYTGLKYEPAAVVKLLESSACSTDVLAEVGENVYPIEFKEGGHDDHGDHDEEGHDDEKKAMMKMKKAMMTTMDMKDMAMEHTIHTSGLTQIELYMQPNI